MFESDFQEILDDSCPEYMEEPDSVTTGKMVLYTPYIECPRCEEWKLAARVKWKPYKKSNGFLKGSEKGWEEVEALWNCKNCKAQFDVERETRRTVPSR